MGTQVVMRLCNSLLPAEPSVSDGVNGISVQLDNWGISPSGFRSWNKTVICLLSFLASPSCGKTGSLDYYLFLELIKSGRG